jgi:hypothetical protein
MKLLTISLLILLLPVLGVSVLTKITTTNVAGILSSNVYASPDDRIPPGDIDYSGKINVLDFAYLISKWGSDDSLADLDDSGTVDHLDANIILANWNQSPVTPISLTTQPGDIYKAFSRTMGQNNKNWRVTGYDAVRIEAQTAFCKQMQENLVLNIGDIDNAKRAEGLINLWGGHDGTKNKEVCFNNTNSCEDKQKACITNISDCTIDSESCKASITNKPEWIAIPYPKFPTTDPNEMSQYIYQNNPVIDIPLTHLQEGDISFMGKCCCKRWPQWGWMGMMVRVFYNSKTHPSGQILSPASGTTLAENPEIIVSASSGSGIKQVEVLAYYEGYDENGDGVWQDFHHGYFPLRQSQTSEPNAIWEMEISDHVGTATSPETDGKYKIRWDTEWVPDQADGNIKLIARIQDNNGVWYVSNVVENLSLDRPNRSVKLYKAKDIPPKFYAARRNTLTSKIDISTFNNASAARLFQRNWNGQDRDDKMKN